MQKPMAPPELSDILAGSMDRLVEIHHILSGVEDRYLHWDELRYRTPPEGLTHEEWWAGLKLGRRAQFRPTPLVDGEGRPFVYSLPDEALRMLQHIERFASGSIELPESIATSSHRDRYIKSSLIEEAITSSQLEGASTSRVVAKRMLESGREPRDGGERMIVNNFAAMRRIGERRREPLTVELVQDIHRIVSKETLRSPELEGRFQREGEERVGVFAPGDDSLLLHEPPPARELPSRVATMVEFSSAEPERFLPPVIRAIILHFWIGYDHPFEDGNGRTARAVFYWSLLHDGYWLAEYLSVSRVLKAAPSKYARSFLLTETDDNDLTYFILYQLDVICRAIDDLRGYLERKAVEHRASAELVRAGGFNHRQAEVLDRALRGAAASVTIDEHRARHDVVYQTARADLLDLVARGLFEQRRDGRRFRFEPVEDLASRLPVTTNY